jgi:hypothetical protein
MFLELLRDPSKRWRVDMYSQASGEEEWLPLFSKVVGLFDQPSATDGVPWDEMNAGSSASLVGTEEIPNEAMRPWETVGGTGSSGRT